MLSRLFTINARCPNCGERLDARGLKFSKFPACYHCKVRLAEKQSFAKLFRRYSILIYIAIGICYAGFDFGWSGLIYSVIGVTLVEYLLFVGFSRYKQITEGVGCPACGYDLKCTESDACPECGKPIPS